MKSPQPSARESRANSKEAQDLLRKCQGAKNTLPNLPLPQIPESRNQDIKGGMRNQEQQKEGNPFDQLTPREKYAFFVSALRNGNWGQDIIDACLGRQVGSVEANIAQAVGGLRTFDFADRQVVTYVETLQQLQASVLGSMERARDGVYYRKVTSLG
ncbi:MAG: hypothetical protein IPJ69_13045 [Deltaproteobacteria bacterium]|nr:MAG: hypothetical protein IPJ69_13045 [Deltaproteobacteria bacterium]